MAHRIVWSSRAAQDLDSITEYIAADSPAYAGVVLKNIVNQTRILARFPQAGRKVPEFDDEDGASPPSKRGIAPLPHVLQRSLSHPHQVAGMRLDHDPDGFAWSELESVAGRQR